MSDPQSQGTCTMPAFAWHELCTKDGAKARDFYGKLLGWTTSPMPMGDAGTYTLFHAPGAKEGDQPIGGMMEMKGEEFGDMPPQWMLYLSVPDVDAAAAKVEKLGGTICVPPTDIPNIGRFCMIKDPTGAGVSLFQMP